MKNVKPIRLNGIGRLAGLSFIILHLSFLRLTAQTMGRYSADFSIAAADFADTIAIEWEREQVYVPVVIGGQSYRFLLDTGAGMSVVYEGTALAGSPHVGDIISRDATGRTDTVAMVALPAMQLGSTTLYGCRATVHPSPSTLHPFDGILGFDLVNGGLSMKIDVARRQLIITDRKRLFDREEGAIQMKYRLDYHVPYIDITPFDRHHERVLFDTGSRQFFSMNKKHFDEATADTAPNSDCTVEGRSTGRHAIGHYGTEPEGEVAFIRLDGMKLGRHAFSGVHAITTQGGSHIGAPLLAYGSVAFNARSRKMIFVPASDVQPCRVDNEQIEIAFVADSRGRPQVGLLWEQGTPFSRGFRQGDIIEQIDRRPVRDFVQFINWGFEPGREYVFTVRSQQGERRDVRWVRLKEGD